MREKVGGGSIKLTLYGGRGSVFYSKDWLEVLNDRMLTFSSLKGRDFEPYQRNHGLSPNTGRPCGSVCLILER